MINLSLGADPGVQALALGGAADEVRDAAREAAEAGVVVIAAAGNESASVCADRPRLPRSYAWSPPTGRSSERPTRTWPSARI